MDHVTEAVEMDSSNFYRALSTRPEAMREVAALHATLMGPGELDQRTKELVYLAVSAVNECDYCTSHHEARAREIGISENEIQDVRSETDQTFSDRDRAALRYAREMTRTAAREHETQQRIDSSFEPEQIVELSLVVALANFTNRITNGLGIPLEKGQGKDKHRAA